MFTMNAIKSINKSIRGSTSVLMKGPLLAEMGKTGHSRRSGKFQKIIAGSVAMTAAKAWLVANGRKALGELGKQKNNLWENVHVCVGGKSAAMETAAADAAAKNHSLYTMTAGSCCSESQQSSVVRLFSSFSITNFRSKYVQFLVPFRKFVWYGQMSNRHSAGGICGAWYCLVQARHRFRMVQEIKAMVIEKQIKAMVILNNRRAIVAELKATVKTAENRRAVVAELKAIVIAKHRRAVVAEIQSIPAAHFAQRYWRCAAAEATRGVVAAAAPGQKLATEDVKAIQDYSGDGYTDMNASLRMEQFAEPEQGRVVAVVQALAKLPVYKGKAVYRGTDLPDSMRIQVGAEFQDMGFLSTSRTRKRAFDKPYLFIVHKSCTGVDIMKHSSKRSEQEVLFPPSARFLITAVKTEQGEDSSWKTIVDMEEIAPKARYVCQTAL